MVSGGHFSYESLAEVSKTEQSLWVFPNPRYPGENRTCKKNGYQALFLPPPPPCTRPKNEVITHAAHEGYIQFEMIAKSFILAAKVLQPKKEKVVSNFVISAAHLSSLVEYTGREN